MILPTNAVVFALTLANKVNEEEVLLEGQEGFFRIRGNDMMHHLGFELRIPEAKVKDFKKDFAMPTTPAFLLKVMSGLNAPDMTVEKLDDGQLHVVCGKRESTMHVASPVSSHLFEKFDYQGAISKENPTSVKIDSGILKEELVGLLKAEPLSLTFSVVGGRFILETSNDMGKTRSTFPDNEVQIVNSANVASSFQLGTVNNIKTVLDFAPSVELFVGQNRPIVVRAEANDMLLAYMAAPFIPSF